MCLLTSLILHIRHSVLCCPQKLKHFPKGVTLPERQGASYCVFTTKLGN